MPYFGLHSPTKLVALARSRMHVNLIDIETGTIEAYFKAGEDRFLNSLLVSGNGRYIINAVLIRVGRVRLLFFSKKIKASFLI